MNGEHLLQLFTTLRYEYTHVRVVSTVESYDKNWHFSVRESGVFIYFLTKFWDSRRFQLAMYAVVHEESESAVRIDQFLHPEEKIMRNQPTRVSISYCKFSYYTAPPY